MNTILKRKLSSVIASESIAKNIGRVKHKGFCNAANSNTNNTCKKNVGKPKNHINQKVNKDFVVQSPNKRQKKTHYNEHMEPIKISSTSDILTSSYPKRIREVVWNTYNGETYTSKCYVPWCSNIINVFNYQVGHDVPESKGGTYEISNLRPICGNCNLSMGNKWTIQEWGRLVNNDTILEDAIHIANKNKNNKMLKNTDVDEDNKCHEPIKNENPVITKETTSRITFLTILFLALNFMII